MGSIMRVSRKHCPAGRVNERTNAAGVIGFAVDEVAQCTGLAAQVSDHVPKIDAVPPVRMTDPHTRRGHYLGRA
jgi:hypothetical protein